MRAGTIIHLSFWCKSHCFACTKRQVRSGTHRDLSKRRCFASKNHRWELGPIETSNSDSKHALVCAQNDRSCLVNIETCYSCPEVTVLHAKTTSGVLDPLKLVSLVLKLLLCMKKTQMRAGTHMNLSFWCKSHCFACTQRQVRSGIHRDLLFRYKSRCLHPKTTHEGRDP